MTSLHKHLDETGENAGKEVMVDGGEATANLHAHDAMPFPIAATGGQMRTQTAAALGLPIRPESDENTTETNDGALPVNREEDKIASKG
ncbi:hypothetical protein HOG17_01040 [Candidatus Peregrinibacteria bacterium]|jgi:hypothetical protein|nr:hypothetical protein [Candidatus Peregrinibacteria bacterium]MBT4148695.1 hypothetical protein [Candidatus Peregrinibacteria bacterium]MBT4366264.1 hypothetical protein [Candidatus Peregrinibacteria bacterium]MBT4456340.1 hypothetical protein [Candidatus Peregrinibacteria bacterium]